jgi:hypothetical protein
MADTNESTPAVSLSLQGEIKENWLQIHYTVSNHGKATILTYDGAAGDGAQGWPDLSSQVYVSFAAPHMACVKRVRPPLPKDRDVTFVRMPAVYRLAPGQSREVRFRLPLPLVERSEWSPHFKDAKYELRSIEQVQLWVGYFEQQEGTQLKPLDKAPGAYLVRGVFGKQEFATRAIALRLDLKARVDAAFERM